MTDDTGPVIRPFADTFRELAGGEVADDAAVQLAGVTAAVAATRKKGTLIIKIDVAPTPGVADALSVTATVAAKLPADAVRSSIFYADDAGNLLRDHPRQTALFDASPRVAQPDARISDAR